MSYPNPLPTGNSGPVPAAERLLALDALRGVAFAPIFYRRSTWLIVIGLLHGYFIWFGDILFHYALMVFLFRRATP